MSTDMHLNARLRRFWKRFARSGVGFQEKLVVQKKMEKVSQVQNAYAPCTAFIKSNLRAPARWHR